METDCNLKNMGQLLQVLAWCLRNNGEVKKGENVSYITLYSVFEIDRGTYCERFHFNLINFLIGSLQVNILFVNN